MVGNSTFIQIPKDVTNPVELRRFLDKLVQQLDIAFGNRGDSAFVTSSNYFSNINSLQDLINALAVAKDEIYDEFNKGANINIVNTSTNIEVNEYTETILCNCITNDITIKLPNPSAIFTSNKSRIISISKIDESVNKVNIIPNNNELIAGYNNVDLLADNEVINLITNGTNWYLGA